jgi:hypothetical protein
MRVGCLSQAELDAKLRTARGAKRRKILRELQRRYDETVPLKVDVRLRGSNTIIYSFELPRCDFALLYGL